VPEESRSEGQINFKVYRKYFTAGANYFVIFILLLFNILAQVSSQEPEIELNVFWVCLFFFFFFFFFFLKQCMLVTVMFQLECLATLCSLIIL